MIQNISSLGLIYGLMSMVGWGSGDFVAAKLSREIGNLRGLLWVMVFSDIFIFLYFILSKSSFVYTEEALMLSVVGGLLHTFGGLAFYKGFEVGKVSLVSAISSAWSLILVLAALLFYGERLTLLQGIAVCLVIGGSVLVSTDVRELIKSSKLIFSDPGVPYGFGAMFGWGLGWLFFNRAVDQISWLVPNIVLTTSVIAFLIIYGLLTGQSLRKPRGNKEWRLVMFSGLVSIVAYITYSIGVERYMTSLVAPVAAAFPVVTVLLARIFLKEKVNATQGFGMLAIIAGVVMLSI